jgi:hypothetical protein
MPATLFAQAGKVLEAGFLQLKRNWIANGRLGVRPGKALDEHNESA